ncbi:MAG: hypothetical protein ACOX6W_10945 [Lentisphaeria bacterium]
MPLKNPSQRGSAYLDYFLVNRLEHIRNNMSNPDFEAGEPGQTPLGWSWWHREQQKGECVITTEAHSGRGALRIKTPEGRDLGAEQCVFRRRAARRILSSDRMGQDGRGALSRPSASSARKMARWRIGPVGRCNVWGKDWRQCRRQVCIPDDIDEVYVRVVGSGACEALIDDLALTRIDGPGANASSAAAS